MPSTPAVADAQAAIRRLRLVNRVAGPIMAMVAGVVLLADAQGWLGLTSTERGAAWLFMAMALGGSIYLGYVKKWPEEQFVEASLAPRSVQRKRTLLMFVIILVIGPLVPLQVLAERGEIDRGVAEIAWFAAMPVLGLLMWLLLRLNRPLP